MNQFCTATDLGLAATDIRRRSSSHSRCTSCRWSCGGAGDRCRLLDPRRRGAQENFSACRIASRTTGDGHYIGSAALLLYLNDRFHPISLDVPSAAPTLTSFVVQVALYMVAGEFLTYWWHRLEHGNKFVFTARALPASPRRVPVDHLDQLRRPPRRGADGDAVPVHRTAGTGCASIGDGDVRGAQHHGDGGDPQRYDMRFYPSGCCRLPPTTTAPFREAPDQSVGRHELRRQGFGTFKQTTGFVSAERGELASRDG